MLLLLLLLILADLFGERWQVISERSQHADGRTDGQPERAAL